MPRVGPTVWRGALRDMLRRNRRDRRLRHAPSCHGRELDQIVSDTGADVPPRYLAKSVERVPQEVSTRKAKRMRGNECCRRECLFSLDSSADCG